MSTRARVVGAITLIALALAALSLWAFALDQRPITVGASANSDFQKKLANDLVADLRERGYAANVELIPASDFKSTLVDDPDSNVNVAITSTAVMPSDYPNTRSLGVLAELPILLAYWKKSGPVESIRDLEGKTIALAAEGSTLGTIGRTVLASYGITSENSTLVPVGDAEVEETLRTGQADAAFSFYVPGDESFDADSRVFEDITILPMPEHVALAGRIGTVVPSTIPRGAFSIVNSIPDADIPTVSVPVRMLADETVGDGAAYAIAEALQRQFSRGTELALPGTFPSVSGSFPVHEAAREYYEQGTIPWQYENLPWTIADRFTGVIVAASLLLILASLYQLILPELITLWGTYLRPWFTARRQARLVTKPDESQQPEASHR